MYTYNLTKEEAKELLKKLQKDAENIKKGSMRKVFSIETLSSAESAFYFAKEQNKNFYERLHLEQVRASLCRHNEKELLQFGFKKDGEYVFQLSREEFKGKPDEIGLKQWTEKTYVNISEQLWDNEFEQKHLLEFIKTLP